MDDGTVVTAESISDVLTTIVLKVVAELFCRPHGCSSHRVVHCE
jgi:hypothetical protein